MIHYCMGCGAACDCWAFDSTHGDICDKCSDCQMTTEDPNEQYYGEGDAGRGAVQTTGEHLMRGDDRE